MKYNEGIDYAIINELSKNHTYPYRELKRKIEKRLPKKISFDVYNLHVRKLLKANILRRGPVGKRGKKVLYSIAEEAKRQIQLKLIAHPKQDIFRKIYEKFFFYEVHYSPRKVISSEREFSKLLLELNTTENKLKWWLWSGAGTETNYTVARELYDNSEFFHSMSHRSRKIHNEEMKMYWLEKGGQSRTVEDIYFISSIEQKNFTIDFTKIERWEINKHSNNKKLHTKYVYELPGVSIEEFLANKRLSKFKLADVKEAFNLLQKNHLIEIALKVQNQTRFKITDNVLRNFIEGIRDIHVAAEYRYLMYKWQHFDAPSHEEIQRWTLLMGEQVASKFFERMEIERRKYKKMKEDCKSVQEFIENLNKEPHLSSRNSGWGFEFDVYERQKKTAPATPKGEIEEFDKFRRARLEYYLKFLPANLEEEGIEKLKMMFKDIIEQYSFLKNVVRILCPYVFEPDYKDSQAKII